MRETLDAQRVTMRESTSQWERAAPAESAKRCKRATSTKGRERSNT